MFIFKSNSGCEWTGQRNSSDYITGLSPRATSQANAKLRQARNRSAFHING